MAKCDEGYRCDVCGNEVEHLTESSLYLRYVIGELDPELLHTTPDRHLRCNPVLAQFICDSRFESVIVEGDFDKRTLDSQFSRERESLVTRGYQRLYELDGETTAIIDYPLPEVCESWRRRVSSGDAAS